MTPVGRKLDWLCAETLAQLKSGGRIVPPVPWKKPIELAGMAARLDRARGLEVRVGKVGAQYDKVLNAIEEKTEQAEQHVGGLEQYDRELGAAVQRMIGERTNSPPEGEAGQEGRDDSEKAET